MNFDCKFFNGYKPCKYLRSCEYCPHYTKRGTEILLINLGALGDVARTTALLLPIKRKYPKSTITWLTSSAAIPILQNIDLIDEVLALNWEQAEVLKQRKFDVLLNVDKEKITGALANQIDASIKRGFTIGKHGEIQILNNEALENYDLGLNDQKKFFPKDPKSELQILAETMGFDYKKDDYQIALSPDEQKKAARFKQEILAKTNSKKIIGFNTGCSNLYPYKKFTLDDALRILGYLLENDDVCISLLGGKEDTERMNEMLKLTNNHPRVYVTPSQGGIREGMVWIAACDTIFSGDSFGMHLSIGLKIPTVAWFGLSIPSEIEFYGRGEAIVAHSPCAPCWKKQCSQPIKCYEQVPLKELAEKTLKWAFSI